VSIHLHVYADMFVSVLGHSHIQAHAHIPHLCACVDICVTKKMCLEIHACTYIYMYHLLQKHAKELIHVFVVCVCALCL
jgi:hypothetical protein